MTKFCVLVGEPLELLMTPTWAVPEVVRRLAGIVAMIWLPLT